MKNVFFLLMFAACGSVSASAINDGNVTPTPSQIVIQDVDLVVSLARDGEYGRIGDSDQLRLEEAQRTIETLLQDVHDPKELDAERRESLFNARGVITAIVRDDEPNRRICKRVQVTGSRIAAAECLTVAQREARARAAKEQTSELQKVGCVPGEGNRCGR